MDYEKNIKRELWELIRDGLVCIIVVYIIFSFIVNIVVVYGESMEPMLVDGDVIISTPIKSSVERGDIVVCKPSNYESSIVKRVIAIEGDLVQINTAGNIYVNGVILEEDYLLEEMEERYEESFVEVEKGGLFVLGDNRNNSMDSRDERIGIISIENVSSIYLFKLPHF